MGLFDKLFTKESQDQSQEATPAQDVVVEPKSTIETVVVSNTKAEPPIDGDAPLIGK
jgi:hypothetical protein